MYEAEIYPYEGDVIQHGESNGRCLQDTIRCFHLKKIFTE